MPRRGSNEGNIYRRTDGRWEARISLGYRGGRRIRRSYYGRTRREVQEQLDAARRDRHEGVLAPDKRLTLGRFLARWLAEAVRPAARPSTVRAYEMICRLYLTPDLGHVPLVRLTALDVQTMMNGRLRSGLSPRTVHHIRAVLRRSLTHAVRWGLISKNVATLVDPPRVPRYAVRPVSPDDARQILAAVRGDRLEALFASALAIGLRQGEALGLMWSRVDLDRRQVVIAHALQRVDRKLQLVEPKTGRSHRVIAIPDVVAAQLRAHRIRQLEERLVAGDRWHDGDFVFSTAVGTPLDGPNVTHRFQALLSAAGLPRMRFHDLRHACASLLLAQGVHPRVVMDVLGHSQISLTMNTYAHVIPALRNGAAAEMDAALSSETDVETIASN